MSEMIREHEQFDILHYAFRYALGRRTMASRIMSDALIHAWPMMSAQQRDQIAAEICSAIEAGRAGDHIDVVEWRRVLDHAEVVGRCKSS